MSAMANHELYDTLGTLRAYGISEQHRINALDLPLEDKLTEMGQLVHDMDEATPIMTHRVSVKGTRIVEIPVITDGMDVDDIFSPNAPTKNVLSPDEELGYDRGYAARGVAVEVEGEVLGTRLVLCHMVHNGDTDRRIDDDGNVVTKEFIGYFAVESSNLVVAESPYLHNLKELRAHPTEMYEDLDTVIYDETLTIGQRIAAIHGITSAYKYQDMSGEEQHTIASYINSCELIKGLQIFSADYALFVNEDNVINTGENDIIKINGAYVHAVIHSFMPTVQTLIEEPLPGVSLIVPEGECLGLRVDIYYDEDCYKVILPLNQVITMAGEELSSTASTIETTVDVSDAPDGDESGEEAMQLAAEVPESTTHQQPIPDVA